MIGQVQPYMLHLRCLQMKLPYNKFKVKKFKVESSLLSAQEKRKNKLGKGGVEGVKNAAEALIISHRWKKSLCINVQAKSSYRILA